MLTPEQAKALKDQRDYRSGEPRRLQAIADLPEPLRPIAYGLLYRDAAGKPLPTGYEHQPERNAHQERALAQLDALASDERMQIFAAFFPSIPEYIELGWTYLRSLPYERAVTYRQEFFRAPHRPSVTLRVRGIWLLGLVNMVGPQDDLAWLAHHGAYLQGYGGNHLGLLFAAAIDGDPVRGPEVFEILVRSARGEDEIGTFGRHIPIALLAASRPDGWECVERLLLGAQREEGLRQTILEALAVAHSGAFRHILSTILDHNLVRFSSVTRAVNGWLDTTWDSAQAREVTRVLRQLHTMLADPDARSVALESGSGEDVYLTLWATACEDIYAALPLAERLLDAPDVSRRYAAVKLLATAYVPEAMVLLLRALADPDARLVAHACVGLGINSSDYRAGWLCQSAPDAFERLEAVLSRQPRRSAQPLLWNIPAPKFDRKCVADLLIACLGERNPKRLIPYLGMFGSYGRMQTSQRLAESDLTDPEVRAALFALLKDRASWVRQHVLTALQTATLHETEAPALEALLGRTSEDLRRDVLSLLLAQPDDIVLASAARLTAASSEQQRLAGLEALRLLHDAGRGRPACAVQATSYRERHRTLTAAEQALLAPILEDGHEIPSLENALGLVRLDELTPPITPVPRDHSWTSPAAIAGLQSLDDLIHEHRADAYTVETWQGRQEALLGNDVWRFPQPDAKLTRDDDIARLPFADLWRGWVETRGEALRDGDGLELLRMLIQIDRRGTDETRAILAEMLLQRDQPDAVLSDLGQPDVPRLTLRYPAILEKLCWWLVRLYSPADTAADAADFLLDHFETVLTQIPDRELRDPEDSSRQPHYRAYQKLQQAAWDLCAPTVCGAPQRGPTRTP